MTARALYDFQPSAAVELELKVSFPQCLYTAEKGFASLDQHASCHLDQKRNGTFLVTAVYIQHRLTLVCGCFGALFTDIYSDTRREVSVTWLQERHCDSYI